MSVTIPEDVKTAIQIASVRTGVPTRTLAAFAQIESGFNTEAKSVTQVRGLFQITGDTWTGIYKQHPEIGRTYSKKASDQALAAAYHIRDLSERFKDEKLVAIAYNAGPGVAKELIGKNLSDVTNIRNAIKKYFNRSQVESKTSETYQYPYRLAKALGQTLKDGPVSTPFSADPTNIAGSTGTSPQSAEVADPKAPFFQSLTAKCRSDITDLASVINKLDQTQLTNKIMAHPKLNKWITRKHDRIQQEISAAYSNKV